MEGREDGFNALYESTYQNKYYLALYGYGGTAGPAHGNSGRWLLTGSVRKTAGKLYFFQRGGCMENRIVSQSGRNAENEAYGLEGGCKFLIYLPGTPLSKLPDELISWLPPAIIPEFRPIGNSLLQNV